MNPNISESTDHEAIPEPYQMISTDHGSSVDCIPFSTPQGKTKHMLYCLAPYNSSGKKEEMLPSSNRILFGDIPDFQQLVPSGSRCSARLKQSRKVYDASTGKYVNIKHS